MKSALNIRELDWFIYT